MKIRLLILILILVMILVACPALAQNSVYAGKPVQNAAGQGIPATVRVCTKLAVGFPCSPLATIFTVPGPPADPGSGTVIASSTVLTDQNGNYSFGCTPGLYQIQITAQGLNFTFADSCPTITTVGGGNINANNIAPGSVSNYPVAGGSTTVGPTSLNYVAPNLTVSTAGSGNGTLSLSGNTSGACSLSDSATSVAVINNCEYLAPAGTSTAPTLGFNVVNPTGYFLTGGSSFLNQQAVAFAANTNISWYEGFSNPGTKALLAAAGISASICWSSLGQPTGIGVDACIDEPAAGVVGIGTTSSGSDANGAIQAGQYLTNGNCASSGGTCGISASGSVSIAAAATTVTVATTRVTALSNIMITEDSSLGTKLGVTCNTTTGRTYTITTRTAGTSFVITTSAAPVTNPACLGYWIVD